MFGFRLGWVAVSCVALMWAGCGDDDSGSGETASNGTASNGGSSNEATSNGASSNGATSNGATSNGGSGAFGATEYAVATGEALCGKLFECCPNGAGGGFIPNEQVCNGFLGGLLAEALEVSLAQDKATYDGDAAQACVTALEAAIGSLSCSDFDVNGVDVTGLAICEQVTVGKVSAGESCVIEDDGMGATTSTDIVCVPGLVCNSDGVCAAEPKVGDTCDPNDFFGPCGDDLFCEAGGTCAALLADGTACAEDDQCASGTCEGGACAVFDLCGE